MTLETTTLQSPPLSPPSMPNTRRMCHTKRTMTPKRTRKTKRIKATSATRNTAREAAAIRKNRRQQSRRNLDTRSCQQSMKIRPTANQSCLPVPKTMQTTLVLPNLPASTRMVTTIMLTIALTVASQRRERRNQSSPHTWRTLQINRALEIKTRSSSLPFLPQPVAASSRFKDHTTGTT